MRAKYFALEGPDGVGKSSLTKLLAEALNEQGIKCETVREPSDSETGKRIRTLLQEEGTDEVELYYLFLRDRKEQEGRIKQLLDSGVTVISDRTYLSTVVYQTVKSKADMAKDFLNHPEYKLSIVPHLVFILGCDLDTLLARLRLRGIQDRYENPEKLAEVIGNYGLMLKLIPQVIKEVDTTNRPIEEVLNVLIHGCMFELLRTP